MQPSATSGRILAIDWLRGVAVLLMIECHALYLLHPSLESSDLKAFLQQFNGLVAPAFLFAAGFAFALTNGKPWTDAAEKRARARRSLHRIVVILLASFFMREIAWAAITMHPERLMWPDVLMCIALCLLAVWVTLFIVPRRAHVPVLALCLASILLLAPVLPGRELGFFTPWLNNSRHWNTFPVVPMGSAAFWGALVGAFAARARDRRRAIVIGMIASFAIGFAIARAGPLASRVYPGLNTFDLLTMGDRAWKVSLATLALLAIERVYAGKLWWPINVLGTRSLIAYVAHLLLLFGLGPLAPFVPFHQKCSWPTYWALLALLIGGTLASCACAPVITRWAGDRWTRWPDAAKRGASRSAA